MSRGLTPTHSQVLFHQRGGVVTRVGGGLSLLGNDEYTVSLLHMDGANGSTTFTDVNAGGAAKTWTAAGNAQIKTDASKFGGASGYFDGTGDNVSTPDHANFFFDAANFTVDFWFNRNGGDGTSRCLCVHQRNSGSFKSWRVNLISTNVVQAICNFPNLGDKTITGTTAFTTTGWHHVALVRNGVNLTLYVDGVQEATTATLSTEAIVDADGPVYVGAGLDGTSDNFTGWIDEFRVSKGIARYTTGFTPSTQEYG
jgi:hypothetical protein